MNVTEYPAKIILNDESIQSQLMSPEKENCGDGSANNQPAPSPQPSSAFGLMTQNDYDSSMHHINNHW